MLDVLSQSQRGRVCEFKSGDVSIRTPFVMRTDGTGPLSISVSDGRTLNYFGESVQLDVGFRMSASSEICMEPRTHGKVCLVRFPTPENFALPEDIEAVVILNGFELRSEPRKLINAIVSLRGIIGQNVLLIAPGIADASTLALISYMGVDVFDDSVSRVLGLSGIESLPEGELQIGGDVTAKNREAMDRECSLIKAFTISGRLRELVDQRAPSSPTSVAILRLFDSIGFDYQEELCSTIGTKFSCNTTQSLRRPEVLRYRRVLMERYKKPAHKRILLLLPCSAKKPYHISKTHKRFASAIHTAEHDALVHEVIVTSPLGIVPRELDVFFPANSYDIPVTGEWKLEEKAFIREMLSFIISQGYDAVVSHLDDSEELIGDLCEYTKTCIGDPTSPASLTKLDETLRAVAKGMDLPGYCVDRKETVRSVLDFQFGHDVADAIMDADTFAIGRFPYWKIMRGKVQLGMLSAERGMISLTIEGGEILADMGKNIVKMKDFEMKGSLFAVGVDDADPSIRIGDEAVIVQNEKVVAVGVAQMSGREMRDMKRGIAVKVRHKTK